MKWKYSICSEKEKAIRMFSSGEEKPKLFGRCRLSFLLDIFTSIYHLIQAKKQTEHHEKLNTVRVVSCH